VSLTHCAPVSISMKEVVLVGRAIGLDVHRDFCEVAIAEDGKISRGGRFETKPETIALFAQSLGPDDEVVLEATGGSVGIAQMLEPHVRRVVIANAADVRAISHARVKSDRFDARTLARLLAADLIPGVWLPDERTQALRRRVARRAALVRQLIRTKNEIHAVVMRCLLGRPPATDLFGVKGRAWLKAQVLAEAEEETVASGLRQIDFLQSEIAAIDRLIAKGAVGSPEFRRLMTIPGVDIGTAAAVLAAIGDVRRFASARELVAYLGLDPTSHQSGEAPARGGRISKRGNPQARSVLVEAAWTAIRSPGPLRAFAERVRANRGANKAAVAVARKLAVLCWHLLTREEDYAFSRPSLTAKKIRRLELAAGAPPLPRRHDGPRISPAPGQREAERQLQAQAEQAYRRLIDDWHATGPKAGAGATPGRASQTPSKGDAARQAQSAP
jgi:transposase